MARDEHRWHLFLDESGDFLEGSTWAACVAGVLVRDDAPRELAANLRTMIERAVPIAPYPLHTSHANLPPWWLAAWALADDARRAAFSKLHPREAALLPGWLAEARARLGGREDLRPFFDALDARRMPDYDTLTAVRGALAGQLPLVSRSLGVLIAHFRQRLGAMLDLLAEAYSERGCHLVAAAWFPEQDRDGELEGSRYLYTLSALFERILATLRERGPALHRVDAHVARLEIDHPTLAASRRTFLLRAADVGLAVRRAERSPLAPRAPSPDRAPVRIVPDVPAAYDANAHPGLVFADHLSNTLWNAMNDGRAQASWSELSACLTRRVRERPPPRSSDAVLRFEAPVRGAPEPWPLAPMVAVTGAPAEFIRAAWGATPGAQAEGPTRWARQQAERWASLAGRVLA